MRFRLEVWAPNPADAVLWAGGLICDRALDGWDVLVSLPLRSDGRALEILGAEVGRHQAQSGPADLRTTLVKIDASSQEFDRAQQLFSYVCGPAQCLPSVAGDGFRHRLSLAARAFKSYALKVSGLAAEVDATEVFRPANGLGGTGSFPADRPLVHGRIGRWPNAGQCNDASSTPGTSC